MPRVATISTDHACVRHHVKELLNLHDNAVRKGLSLLGQMRKLSLQDVPDLMGGGDKARFWSAALAFQIKIYERNP